MQPLLYRELVAWYHLLDPQEDHLDEMASYRDALARVIQPSMETLLELGSGAGHNAVHLKKYAQCTLTDLSEPMLARSRALNPECEHVHGDMRSLRLGRTFDAVVIHDAIAYMTTRADLLAAAQTAFVHTRPGGAAIVAPDLVRETFREATEVGGGDDGRLALRSLHWTWDPDPTDETYVVDFAFLLRDGETLRAVHDRHVEGLFSRATWIEILTGVGYTVDVFERAFGDGAMGEAFLCRRI